MSSSFMTDPEAIRQYILAARGELTVKSVETGARATFRFKPNKDGPVQYVYALAGPDNETDYQYIGYVKNSLAGLFFHGTDNAPDFPVTAAIWFFTRLRRGTPLDPAKIEVWNSGKCRRCGRKLTSEWAQFGIGPKCAEKET